jgi:predicted nucleotidyltransferase
LKEVIKTLLTKKIILKKLEPFDLAHLESRKKILLFDGVDTASNYISIFVIEKKSRFLQKDVLELEKLFEKLVQVKEHNYKKKILLYKMPMCSKAQKLLKEFRWTLVVLS